MAVSIDDDAVHMAMVGDDGRLFEPRKWSRSQFTTLTDALLAYERDARIPLRQRLCAIAILGVTHGEVITLARGGWALSQVGLRSIFQRDVVVINDVAARAWAVLGGRAGTPLGLSAAAPPPVFGRCGRWAVIYVDRGVGLTVIDVDQRGASRVLECEMGHCGFAPARPAEWALGSAIAARAGIPPSWEMALTLAWDDDVWRADGLPTSRVERVDLMARLVGRYAAEVVLAHGAWSGVVLTGSRIAEITGEHTTSLFNAGFESKARFPRLIRAAPRWHLDGRDVTMAGLAVALEHHPAARTG